MKQLGKKVTLGFTLIEVMIVVAIIGILAAVAYPSYSDYIRRQNRNDGKAQMMDYASRLERYYVNNNGSYLNAATALNLPSTNAKGTYTFFIQVIPDPVTGAVNQFYTLTAVAQNAQTADNVGGVPCSPLTLDVTAQKTPPVCWQQ